MDWFEEEDPWLKLELLFDGWLLDELVEFEGECEEDRLLLEEELLLELDGSLLDEDIRNFL